MTPVWAQRTRIVHLYVIFKAPPIIARACISTDGTLYEMRALVRAHFGGHNAGNRIPSVKIVIASSIVLALNIAVQRATHARKTLDRVCQSRTISETHVRVDASIS